MINENATVEVSKSVIRSLITSFWIRVFTTPRRKKISSRRNPDGATQAFDFDAFWCIFMQYELHSMHFKMHFVHKKYHGLDFFKSRPLTTLRTLPRTRKLTMFLAVFHFDLYFLYLHEDFWFSIFYYICLLRGLGNPGSIGNFFSDSSVKRAPDRRVYDDEIPSTSPRATPPHLI